MTETVAVDQQIASATYTGRHRDDEREPAKPWRMYTPKRLEGFPTSCVQCNRNAVGLDAYGPPTRSRHTCGIERVPVEATVDGAR